MKIGVCGGIDRAPIVKSLGYDYIEEKLSDIATLSDEAFAETVRAYERIDLPVYAFNFFFPAGMPLYGENPFAELNAYAEKAFARARTLGGRICVLGSAKVRNIPMGVSSEFADRRFSEVLSSFGDIAEKYGLRIAIEPLNRGEGNYINTFAEAAEIAKRVSHKNVGALVDFYHFYLEKESEENVIRDADQLIHAHLARPNVDRLVPKATDRACVKGWADLLKNVGYDGAISLEAEYENFEEDVKNAKRYMELFR